MKKLIPLSALLLFALGNSGLAQTITVFTDRVAFEASVGNGRITDDFSIVPPSLPVTSLNNGNVANGKWNDIARDPEPSTVWTIPGGTTAWGGTWDLTVAGTGGGITCEVDFGGGNFVTVPGRLPGGSAANLFFGFTATQPFFAVRVRQFDSVGGTLQETHTFDDMTYQINPSGEIAVHDGPSTAAPVISDAQPAPIDYGTVARGAVSSRRFTVTNTAATPLTVFRLLAGGKFQIANAPTLPATLATGASLNFDIVFSSTDGGTFDQPIRILNTDSDDAQFDFTARASVTYETEFTLTNTQDNADIENGQATFIRIAPNAFGGGSTVSLTIGNNGLDPLVISAISLPAGFFTSLGSFPRSVAGGQTLSLPITSIGPTAGVYTGNVTLTTNDADEGTFTFPIRAFFNLPKLGVSSGFSDFRDMANGGVRDVGITMLGETSIFPIRIKNYHAGSLIVSGVTLPAGYVLRDPAPIFPFTLGKDQLREFALDIVSTTAGTFTGTVMIETNDPEENPFNIQLTGIVSPDSISFVGFSTFIGEGGQITASAVGSGPVSYAWDLDGDGEFDDATGATIALPDSDGPADFLASVRMTDNLTSTVRAESVPVSNRAPTIEIPFFDSILAGTPLLLPFTANDVAADIAAGMTWQVEWGDGLLDSTAAGHPATTSFTHTFTQLGQATIRIDAKDKDGATGSVFSDVWVNSNIIGIFDGADTTGQELRDGQDRLDFQTLFGSTADRSVTVLNRSGSPASLGAVTLPPGFSLVTPPDFPLSLASGATRTLTLRFSPLVPGSTDGVFSISTSDPALPSFEIPLTGEASAPDIVVSEPNSELSDFANNTESFTIFPGTNQFDGLSIRIESGNFEAPLVIQSITLPPNFQLSPGTVFPLDFNSESTQNIRIQCLGASPGFYEGWVSVFSNDPDESPFSFYITCRVGSVSDLLVKSDSSRVSSATGIILNGQSTALDARTPLALHLHNQGNQSLTVSSISLPTGYTFAVPPALPIVVSRFESSILPDILLTPTAPGTYAGEVSIISTDPDENPYHFPITATISGGNPSPPALSTFTLNPATAISGPVFSGSVSGPPDALVVLEGSTDLGITDVWTEITRVTLNASGQQTITNATPPGKTGAPRYFIRLRLGE